MRLRDEARLAHFSPLLHVNRIKSSGPVYFSHSDYDDGYRFRQSCAGTDLHLVLTAMTGRSGLERDVEQPYIRDTVPQ